MVSRRAIVFGAFSSFGGAACAPAMASRQEQVAPTPSKEPATVEFYTIVNSTQKTIERQVMIDPFERAFPHLRLSIIPYPTGGTETQQQKLLALRSSGSPPDVAAAMEPKDYLGGTTQEITALAKRDKVDLSPYPKQAMDYWCTWRGKQTALPTHFSGNWAMMPYNKELFTQAGVPEPGKWGDPAWNAAAWLEALQRTTRRGAAIPDVTGRGGQEGAFTSFGINQIGADIMAVYWPPMWKAAWLGDDMRTLTLDAPAMVEAMEFAAALSAKHRVMATNAQQMDHFGVSGEQAFQQGRLGMAVLAGIARTNVARQVKAQQRPFAYAPLPTFKTLGAAHQLAGAGLVTGARRLEAGWTLMKWMTDTSSWAIWRDIPPARLDHFDAWAKDIFGGIETQVRFDVFRDSFKHAIRPDPIAYLPKYEQIAEEILVPAIQRLYEGKAEVSPTLREIKGPIQALIPTELRA